MSYSFSPFIAAITFLGLYAGAEFATWIAIGPLLASLDGPTYVAAHAALTDAFKPAMPIVGSLALASSVALSPALSRAAPRT